MTTTCVPSFTGRRILPAEDYVFRIPLVPWICPPLHPALLRLVRNIGRETVLEPGERIYSEGEPVNRFAIVQKGLIARKLGDFAERSDNRIGLAGPGNIASGNLNIFSHRPAIGRYEALVPTSIVWCDQRMLLSIVETDRELFKLLALQCELCALSDRLAFATMNLLESDEALKILLLSWTVHFGRLDGDYVVTPRILVRDTIRNVLGCSIGWLDKLLSDWRRNAWREQRGAVLYYRLELLQSANDLLCELEEGMSDVPRPRDVRTYWLPQS